MNNKILKSIILFSVIIFLSGCGEDPVNNTNFQNNGTQFSMDKFEQNIRASLNGQTVGYAYAINLNGQLSRNGDSGLARGQLDPQMSQSSTKRMNIASVTKTITAVAVLQLLERRNLSIDSPIAPWLPPVWILGPGVDTLSFKDLLTQRSGLNSANSNFNGTLSFEALRDSIATGVVNPPTYNYLNMNFALFRVIIPALWKGLPGAPAISEINAAAASFFYRYYVQTQIFDKIGILSTDCVQPSGELPTLFYNINTNTNGAEAGDWSMICGGGGWYLSAVELAKFMAYLRHTNELLSNQSRQLMDQNKLGWRQENTSGAHGDYFAHDGSISYDNNANPRGFTACIMKFDINVEVSLLINSSGGNYGWLVSMLINAYDNAYE